MLFDTKAIISGILAAVVLFSMLCLCFYFLIKKIRKKKGGSDAAGSEPVCPEAYKLKIEGSPLDPETAIVMTHQQMATWKPTSSFNRFSAEPRTSSCSSLTLPRGLRPYSTPETARKTLSLGRQSWPTTPKRATNVEATLVYIAKDFQLTVYVHRITNLPLRHGKKYLTCIMVRLIASTCHVRRSKLPHKSLNPEFTEVFQFSPLCLEDLSIGVLEVVLLAKRKIRFKEIGIWRQELKELGLEAGEPRISTGEMQINMGDTDSEASLVRKHSFAEMGQLLISLQYQSEASRLKVFVRKADGLPDSKGLMAPEYFVVLNVTSESGTADIKETKKAKGKKPVWNEAFLFDIKPTEVESCWLHLTVLRKKHYGHNDAVGHVTLGQNSTPDGEQQWKALLEPRAMEVTQWHRLTPR